VYSFAKLDTSLLSPLYTFLVQLVQWNIQHLRDVTNRYETWILVIPAFSIPWIEETACPRILKSRYKDMPFFFLISRIVSINIFQILSIYGISVISSVELYLPDQKRFWKNSRSFSKSYSVNIRMEMLPHELKKLSRGIV